MKIDDIRLLDSNYKRNPEFDDELETSSGAINYNLFNDYEEETRTASVILGVEIEGDENAPYYIKVSYGGLFVMEDEAEESRINDFMQINAPAILLPYIREHVSSTVLKAGHEPFILPPVNFVNMQDDWELVKDYDRLNDKK